ncbi:hypothetical protein AMR41_29505 [Hapalosiphon sp. MRB220]|nr:hypothetical protein AMR41_29505 [Hapalosiphon sp. MRB220]
MNEKVLSGLNSSEKVEGIYASLIDELSKEFYVFLFNPEEKRFSRQANYNEGITALSSTPSQQYNYTSGLTLRLPNLLLETYNQGKNCKLLIQRIQSLMVADPKKGQYSPTPVKFVWGKDSFGPAVVKDVSWVETSWLNGEVASARVDITLVEIPEDQLSQKARSQSSQERLQQASTTPQSLTNRQKEEARKKADKWLNNNIKKLSDNVSYIVRTKTYIITVDNNGNVTLYDKKARTLGNIGIYKNSNLNTSTNNLIRIK